MNTKYKSTKLPRYIFDEAEMIKMKLLMGGLKELPRDILVPRKCPVCGGEMIGFEIRAGVSYYECKTCGYKQPGISMDIKTTDISTLARVLGLGVILGLGIAALFYLINQRSKG